MGSKPPADPSGPSWRPPRRRIPVLAVAGAATLLAAAGVGWWGAERLVGRLYLAWRPDLETRIGRGLGHPVRLGPYRGLRPWGLAIGPSQVLPGPDDDSSLQLASLDVFLDPLASLARATPVLDLRPRGAQLDLRRNAQGRYWVFGAAAVRRPPRLDLRLRLDGPARVRLSPPGLSETIEGRVAVSLQRRTVDWSGHAGAGGAAGRIALDGSADWGTGAVRLTLTPRRWNLAPLTRLLRPSTTLAGTAEGRLQLTRRPGAFSCRGQLRLQGLSLADPRLPAPLRADPLALRCRADQLSLDGSRWRMANWQGRLDGRLAPNRWFDLRLAAADPRRGDRLALAVQGPWRQPRLRLDGRIPVGKGTPTSPAPLDLQADISVDGRGAPAWRLDRLRLLSGRSELVASGALWPRLDLRSSRLSLAPDLWRPAGGLAVPLLGQRQPVVGELRAAGSLARPTLNASLRQQGRPLLDLTASASPASDGPAGRRPGPLGRIALALRAPSGIRLEGTPVLGPATANLLWSADRLRLLSFRAPELSASGTLPLRWQRRRGLVAGDLALDLNLAPYRLARITPLLGVRLLGELQASGRLSGPLRALRPDLRLAVRHPGSGPLQLMEEWQGRLSPAAGGGGTLRMTSLAPALNGDLLARLDPSWLPRQVLLRREGGELRFDGTPRRYRWTARALPLAGLRLAVGSPVGSGPLQGLLSGSGSLGLQPLAMEAGIRLERPALLGLRARSVIAQGRLRQGDFQLRGSLLPLAGGSVALDAQGRREGPLRLGLEGRQLPLELLQQLAEALPQWRGAPAQPTGRAADLGELFIDTLGGSLDGQLAALAAAQRRVEAFRTAPPSSPRFRPQDLRGVFDVDAALSGPRPDTLQLDVAAKGHLWVRDGDRDQALKLEPVVARFQGPLRGGRGGFSLENIPLGLLALLTPVPDGLRGGLSIEGRYRLGGRGRNGRATAFRTRLQLRDATLNGTPLEMQDAVVRLEGDTLALSGALRSGGASDAVELSGSVPLDPAREGLKLRLSSRGDGLRFIAGLVRGGFAWRRGSADLELLVRGSLQRPEANGFLRFRDGEIVVAGQEVRDLQATVLFDFQELLVQEFRARMGEKGVLEASGGLGLFQASPQPRPLRMVVRQARIDVPRLRALADGALELQGSLLRPRLTGQLQISKGTINGQPGSLGRDAPDGRVRPVTIQQLAEEKWDFREPLVLLGPEVESSTGLALRQAVPNFPYLQLSDLRLELGPDLLVVVPPVASFNTGGSLTLNGRIDSSLRASGVVRLRSGRLSLFTTNFTLDPDAPNVAVFTPSLGLVPYVDIALRTRVSNTLEVGRDRGAVNDSDLRGGYTPLDQLNLVKVVVTVSGPADRLGESIELRSTPPLPRERLVALIGGNSLAGLSGGSATTALATVVGQSLLSPLVSSLSNAFGQRVSFALYPTFVSPTVTQSGPAEQRRIPAQLVLGSELGLDLTNRFNLSVLAAPNRSDIPPQFTLRYQASDTLGLQGSFDSEGRWQTQLQLFFRF